MRRVPLRDGRNVQPEVGSVADCSQRVRVPVGHTGGQTNIFGANRAELSGPP